jgi:hypothetical protein
VPLVSCDKCGKKLNAKEEWVGKKLKCPACGNAFVVGGGAVAAAPKSKPNLANPAAEAAARAKKKPQAARQQGGISINYMQVTLLGIVALLILAGILFWVGPKQNWAKWGEMEENARTDVVDVIVYALEKKAGADETPVTEIDGIKVQGRGRPTIQAEIGFRFTGYMQWSFPEWVKFTGNSTAGPVDGRYNTQTHEIEATIKTAMTLNPITGDLTGDPTQKMQITGKADDSGGGRKLTASVDGKPLQ